jgi:hypothetical protein
LNLQVQYTLFYDSAWSGICLAIDAIHKKRTDAVSIGSILEFWLVLATSIARLISTELAGSFYEIETFFLSSASAGQFAKQYLISLHVI